MRNKRIKHKTRRLEENYNETFTKLKEKKASLDKEVRDLENKLSDLTEDYDKKKQFLLTYENLNKIREENIVRLKEMIHNLIKEFEKKRNEYIKILDKYDKKKKDLIKEIDKLQKNKDKLKEDIKKQKKNKKELKDEIRELKKQNTTLKSNVNRLKDITTALDIKGRDLARILDELQGDAEETRKHNELRVKMMDLREKALLKCEERLDLFSKGQVRMNVKKFIQRYINFNINK